MSRPRDEQATVAITEAARRQLAELGYANLSMDSVAAEAGVARTTVYRRYRDKADLVTAAIAADPVAPGPMSANTGATSDDPRSDLVQFLSAFDERFADCCLEVLGALLGSREDPGALALHRRRVIEPRLAYGRSLVVRGQELGLLDPAVDPDVVLQMLTGAVLTRRVTGVPAEEGWVERAVAQLWPKG